MPKYYRFRREYAFFGCFLFFVPPALDFFEKNGIIEPTAEATVLAVLTPKFLTALSALVAGLKYGSRME